MGWLGVIILVVAGLAASQGRVYPGLFGAGIGFLFLWYYLEREREEPAATEDELESLSESLHESSANLDDGDLPEFFHRIASSIQSGFGEKEIARLLSLSGMLRQNREKQVEFQVMFQGASTPLRIHLFKNEPASTGIYFFTSKPLADFLDLENESYFAEQRR